MHPPPLLRLVVRLSRLRLLLLRMDTIIRSIRLRLPVMSSTHKLCVLSACDSCQASVVDRTTFNVSLLLPSVYSIYSWT